MRKLQAFQIVAFEMQFASQFLPSMFSTRSPENLRLTLNLAVNLIANLYILTADNHTKPSILFSLYTETQNYTLTLFLNIIATLTSE